MEMSVPSALYLDCPSCEETTVHEVLKGRIGKKQDKMEATVKCQVCGQVYSTVVREREPKRVPIIISELGKSKSDTIELDPEEELAVGEELYLEDLPLLITALESSGKRVSKTQVSKVDTIWSKKFDKVVVKISINKHTKTIPAETTALPDEEFYVGDIMTVGKEDVVIHSIKTKGGTLRKGGAPARDIVRVYARSMRTTYA
jgi:uncharacterized Zn finger protein